MSRDEVKPKPGHQKLLEALSKLLTDAQNFQFHDFKNTRHPFPKIVLKEEFQQLANDVMNGEFDNDEDDPEMLEDEKPA